MVGHLPVDRPALGARILWSWRLGGAPGVLLLWLQVDEFETQL